MRLPKQITPADIEAMRDAVETPAADGHNFDRLCYAILVGLGILLEIVLDEAKEKP